MAKSKLIGLVLGLVIIVILGGYIAYALKGEKDQSQPTTTTQQGAASTTPENEAATWPIYRDNRIGVEFQYPPEYDSDPHRDWVWIGDGGAGAEAHLVSREAKRTIHVVEEPFDSRHCLFEFCVAKAKSEVSKNDIIWDYLGMQSYCDVGECAPARSVYRTTHDNSRYYVLFDEEKRENAVLSSFKFLK